jgi:hypothetical protein
MVADTIIFTGVNNGMTLASTDTGSENCFTGKIKCTSAVNGSPGLDSAGTSNTGAQGETLKYDIRL